MSALDDILKKHRKKIIDREESTFGQLLSAYEDIENDLKKSFQSLESEMQQAQENGEENLPSWLFREQRLKKLLEQVQEQILRFGGKASTIIENEQKNAIKIAIEQAQENYKFLIGSATDKSVFRPRLDTRSVETAVGLLGDGSPLIDYFEQTLAPAVTEKIKSEIIKASALGTDFRTVANNLRATGEITKYRAFSVARTEVNRVRRETTREIFKENDDLIEEWEWVASKSVRTCPLCLAMDGKRFPLSEPFPQHINCRCTMISILKGLKERRPRTIGKDWFESQDDATKQNILGKEAFLAYQDNNIDLDDFVAFKNDKRFGKSVTRKPLAKILADKKINPGISNVIAKSIKYEKFEEFKPNAQHGRQWNEQISNILLNDPVASRAYQRYRDSGTKLIFEGNKLDNETFGLTEKTGPTNLQARIFLPLNISPEQTVSTIIHESRHVKRWMKNKPVSTQLEEIMAASIEFVYNKKRRPNKDERQLIRQMVKQVYKDLPER